MILKAIKFPDANLNVAEDQKEYNTLPMFALNDQTDTRISCYKMTFWDRFRVLFTGKIWLSEMNFHRKVTPRIMATRASDLYTKHKES